LDNGPQFIARDFKEFIRISGMTHEDFMPLFRAVLATQWPAVIQEQSCQAAYASESYAGSRCKGTLLIPSFPSGPNATASEDYPGPQKFNSIVGEHLTIHAHMRLTPVGSTAVGGGK
jgi:hypothetical protein